LIDDVDLPREVWRAVPSLQCIEASSHGRIRKKPSVARMPNGTLREYSPKPTFGQITSALRGARSLRFNVVYRSIGNVKVHAAVCEAFHGPNPDPRKGVRHLNENGLDNRPENLMWASQKVNINDPKVKRYHYERISPFCRAVMSKQEKRRGIYENIIDIGMYQRELRASNRRATNDNMRTIHKEIAA
jgi:hypothetical protein